MIDRPLLLSLCLTWLTCCCGDVRAKGPAKFMMKTEIDGQELVGQPLAWDQKDMCMLCRDGSMPIFANKDAKNSRKIERSFFPYTSAEMKERIREEFGHRYAVSSSEHFVAVHDPNSGSDWAERMETLYRTFRSSMRVRGISTSNPQVTMVAVIFRNRGDYFDYFAQRGKTLPKTTMGHYEQDSNRVYLFDASRSQAVLDTVVHEATHQTAYNVGVHRRRAEQPSWLVEGLAMMFETPGMREAWSIQSRGSRINRERLDRFREYLERRPEDALMRMVASDRSFRSTALDAYAEAWVLSFYLFETRSQDYSRYLARVASRPPFSAYSARERVADFMSAFGDDLRVIDNQLLRFVDELK